MISYRDYIELAILDLEGDITTSIGVYHPNIYGRAIWKSMNYQQNMFKILLRPSSMLEYYPYKRYEKEIEKNPELLIDMAFGC